MSGRKKAGNVRVEVVKARNEEPIQKAEYMTQITTEDEQTAGDWLEPPVDLRGFQRLVDESSILPQCIRAYKDNVAGFGIGIRYNVDQDETPEMAAEYEKAEEIVELLNTDKDTKEVFEDIVESREVYGIAYVEVIRNLAGQVTQIEFIRDVPSVRKTRRLEPYINVTYYHHGEELIRAKKFRKYRQQISGKTVYYKEFGDPRIMDWRDGEYLGESETLDLKWQANEILEFPLGTEPYGKIRWIGQVLGVDGSRAAENLNNNYFKNGRHTPLLIMVKGGTLTDESYNKLQSYMDGIRGEAGQHKFLILEAESTDGRADFEETEKPEIEVKDLAGVLQKDELFQEYLNNNRRRVQSSFLLPDLYVGYTTDFNRATAQTAMEVTEKQVFQPERKSLAWVINNKLLNEYQFKYVEAYFLEPNITNPDDIYKIFVAANSAGGVTPQMAKEVVCESLGRNCEPYEAEWADEPIAIAKAQNSSQSIASAIPSVSEQIGKAEANGEPDELVAVMKSVKRVLEKMARDEEQGHEG